MLPIPTKMETISNFEAAFVDFTNEASEYISGISDARTKAFGLKFLESLQAKARVLSRTTVHPTSPSHSLVRLHLLALYGKHFR